LINQGTSKQHITKRRLGQVHTSEKHVAVNPKNKNKIQIVPEPLREDKTLTKPNLDALDEELNEHLRESANSNFKVGYKKEKLPKLNMSKKKKLGQAGD
jgi:hypothetical protein